MIKIKINIDLVNYKKLINDIKIFNIVKKNNNINKNLFLNILFKNYYSIYESNNSKLYEIANSLKNKYNIKSDEFINDFMNNMNKFILKEDKVNFNTSITFYLNDENEFIFRNSINIDESYSSYFRKLILDYLEKPQYVREQIIHNDIIDKINISIRRKTLLVFEYKDIVYNVYAIKLTTDNYYNYLVCNNNDFIEEIPISNISKINNTNIKI